MSVATEKRRPGRPKDPNSKRAKGESRYVNERLTVTFLREVSEALAAYLASIEVRGETLPDKSKVVNTALREHLRRLGFYPPPKPAG